MKGKVVAGIFVTLMLVGMMFYVFPVKAFAGTMKIGIIGPVGLTHWDPAGMKPAAEMARDEINAAGGVNLSNSFYAIQLSFANEYAYPLPDPDAAVAELKRLVLVEQCKIIIGGFRTEVTIPIIEAAVSYPDVLFIINGASTTSIIADRVGTAPKYNRLFRFNPVNSTQLLYTIAGFMKWISATKFIGPPIIGGEPQGGMFGQTDCLNTGPTNRSQVPIAVLMEDLAWTVEMYTYLTNPAIYPGIYGKYVNVTYNDRIPETCTDATPYLTKCQSPPGGGDPARMIIHVFSGRAGLAVTAAWKLLGVDAMLFGINVLAQDQAYYGLTGGACNGEGTLATAAPGAALVPGITDVFWNNFVAKSGGLWPIYTAFGAYGAIYLLRNELERVHATPANLADVNFLVSMLEAADTFGATGKFKFTYKHDVYNPEVGPTWGSPGVPGYVRAWSIQWQGPMLYVVCPVDQKFSKKYTILGSIFPSGYESLAESDTVATAGSQLPASIDGTIGVLDLAYITGLFWLGEPGQLTWNMNGDLNDDSVIDIVDATILGRDWGDTVSYPI